MTSLLARREPRTTLPSRWGAFSDLRTLRDRLDRLFDEFVSVAPLADEVWTPLADVEETDDAWLIEADLPGVKRDNVAVELRDGELVIHGEIKEREHSGVLRRAMRRTGEFEYRLALPGDIDENSIEASLADGVLTVRVPKPARAQPRRIEVKSS